MTKTTTSAPHPSARIVWRPVHAASILEARIVDPAPGSTLDRCYVGYVAHDAGEQWRGYLGIEFVPVGDGAQEALQASIEEKAWALVHAGRIRRGGETGGALAWG